MNTDLFHPAPEGLPIIIRPPRGSNKLLEALEDCKWHLIGKGQNGELLRAGALWLHGFLDESHVIAQGISSAEGSYWHALMHRSEGDFANSKYWYRRVGRHAIFTDLLAAVSLLERGLPATKRTFSKPADWDPFKFVDVIEQAATHQHTETDLLQAIAREEYNLLMGHCLAKG